MILKIVKKLLAKCRFCTLTSAIHRNFPMRTPTRDILETITYASFELNTLIINEFPDGNKDGQTDGHTTDRRTTIEV